MMPAQLPSSRHQLRYQQIWQRSWPIVQWTATYRGPATGVDRRSMTQPAPARRRSRWSAWAGLVVGLACAGTDGFLTADQLGPVWGWLGKLLPACRDTGPLHLLIATWPQPRLHWGPLIWIVVGLGVVLLGKIALVPVAALVRRRGRRAIGMLRCGIAVASTAGAALLLTR